MESLQQKSLFTFNTTTGIQFTNRIVMAPMTRSRAIGSIPNEAMARYYGQRATAGLIITEGTATSADALGYPRIPGIFTREQIEGWKKTTDVVHEKGGKIFIQLMHVGRIAHAANMPAGARILAPSAIPADMNIWTDVLGMQKTGTPLAMTVTDIEQTFDDFVTAAWNAMEAGFDGIEIHGANGYLPEQFLNQHTNIRTDRYGGSIENRSAFILEVVKAIADTIGAGKTGVRLSPYNTYNNMPVYDAIYDTYTFLARELQKQNILYLHLIDTAARTSDEGLQLIKNIRQHFTGLLILNGGYDKERARLALLAEGADLISFGSKFLANPDLPLRLENDIALNVADAGTFFTADEIGYTDYPRAIS